MEENEHQFTREEIVAQVNADISEFNITRKELIFPVRGPKGPPKYRHPETGKTWTGKGRVPNWIKNHPAGKDHFKV